jgi:glycolate oxidase FAD binding subunit
VSEHGISRRPRYGNEISCHRIHRGTQDTVSRATLHPATSDELAAILKDNAEGEKQPVLAVGGGTWLDFGHPIPPGLELHTKNLDKVLDYPARDMTITVEAGLSIAALSEILRTERQQIPVDFPQQEQATIGGVIAANVSGPRRFGLGTLRDSLIGLTAVDAGGRVFHAGGRVVKNVAGYDLCKLMIGSWGTLAVLTEVTLKVLPIPETHSWVWSFWNDAEKLDAALAALLTSEARPLAIEVTQGSVMLKQELVKGQFVLAVLVAGSSADTDWQIKKLADELKRHQPMSCETLGDNPEDTLTTLTKLPLSPSPLTFRAHVLPSKTMAFISRATEAGFSVQSHAGNGIIIGHAPAQIQTVEAAQEQLTPLREFAESNRGSLVILDCPADWKPQLDVFGNRPPSWDLMKDLKGSLDPHNLLSPNRLFASEG